jgi:hypothetical protein
VALARSQAALVAIDGRVVSKACADARAASPLEPLDAATSAFTSATVASAAGAAAALGTTGFAVGLVLGGNDVPCGQPGKKGARIT